MKSSSEEGAHKDSLRNRVIYGFSGFFLMLGGMVWNAWSYGFVFLVISTYCQYEYLSLVIPKAQQWLRQGTLALGVFFYTLGFLIQFELLSEAYYFLLYPGFSLILILLLYSSQKEEAFNHASLAFLGLAYVAFPFVALHYAVFWEGVYQYEIILGVFFTIWIHDIGAYFIGFRYGKHALAPQISPKKSWEGSFGGGFLAILMAFLLHSYLPILSLYQWLGLSLIITVIGTFGDLVESMLKRSLAIKDSSQALPGHGGFLDRFDNLLLSAPFIAIFLKFF